MLTGATGPASPFASLCFQGQCSILRVANKIFYTFIQALAIPPTLLSSFLFTSCRSGTRWAARLRAVATTGCCCNRSLCSRAQAVKHGIRPLFLC